MSIGLLVGEHEALMPDPMHIGLLVTRTLRDVMWGDLDYLLIDLPPGTGEPQHTLLRTVQVDAPYSSQHPKTYRCWMPAVRSVSSARPMCPS